MDHDSARRNALDAAPTTAPTMAPAASPRMSAAHMMMGSLQRMFLVNATTLHEKTYHCLGETFTPRD